MARRVIGEVNCPRCVSAGIKQSEPPPPVYKIPARDVVPGMLLRDLGQDRVPITVATLLPAGRFRAAMDVRGKGNGQGFTTTIPANRVTRISLPGPSPREVCCTCWKPSKEPHLVAQAQPRVHMAGCPVAPVDGLHGGMRLWPAPVLGQPWRAAAHGGWTSALAGWVGVPTLSMKAGLRPDQHDMVLQAFYHPPRATFEQPERAPWVARSRWNGRETPWDPEGQA